MRVYQTTIRNKVHFKGIGLHSGSPVQCTIRPASENHGIQFVRTDLRNMPRGSNLIRADISKVVRTDLSTTLGNAEGVIVATVEHLMAALVGVGIDNAVIEVQGPELPIMDGSSREFATAIREAGVKELSAPRKALRLKDSVSVRGIGNAEAQDKWILAQPSQNFSITASIQFKHKLIGEQSFSYSEGSDFEKQVASARTFGFLREVQYLHKKGLAQGGSLENAIVLDEERVLNPDGLRFDDEFVRHKVLDAMGDFGLLGLPILADIRVHKSGHELHAGFLKKILSSPESYEIVELGATAQEQREEELSLEPSLATA